MADVSSFMDSIIARLQQVVEEETALLKSNSLVDLTDFNTRKSQALYDLSRAMHRFDRQASSPETLAKLRSLRGALEANQAALSVHVLAVREIATIVSEAIQEIESDGTYAPPFKPARGRA